MTSDLRRELRQAHPWDGLRLEGSAVRVSLVDRFEEPMVARSRCAGRPELDGGPQVLVAG